MSVFIDKLTISSPDVAAGERIKDEFTADQTGSTPALIIEGIPEGTVELSIILHDPDAPMPYGFTHWIGHGIPAVEGPVDVATMRTAPNSMGDSIYVGPFPPPGHGTHHYYFWVYALNAHVEGTPDREEFLAKYGENIIEQARFVATYSN